MTRCGPRRAPRAPRSGRCWPTAEREVAALLQGPDGSVHHDPDLDVVSAPVQRAFGDAGSLVPSRSALVACAFSASWPWLRTFHEISYGYSASVVTANLTLRPIGANSGPLRSVSPPPTVLRTRAVMDREFFAVAYAEAAKVISNYVSRLTG